MGKGERGRERMRGARRRRNDGRRRGSTSDVSEKATTNE